jgi:hypothetical protein
MIFLRAIAFAPLVFVLVACDQSQQSNNAVEIAGLKETVKQLQESVSTLETNAYLLKFQQHQYDSTSFDPAAGKGFGRVETTGGVFLVSLQEVNPHLDGVMVKLNVGNIQLATYNGFTIVAEYGRRFPAFNQKTASEENKKQWDAYNAASRKKTQAFTEVLRPGTWNVVYLTLPDIKPENFGNLTLSIQTNQVALGGGR